MAKARKGPASKKTFYKLNGGPWAGSLLRLSITGDTFTFSLGNWEGQYKQVRAPNRGAAHGEAKWVEKGGSLHEEANDY